MPRTRWTGLSARPARLLVVGGASLDVLHVRGRGPVHSIGGAGLYTALAAARTGVEVTMLAPVPRPMPEAFAGIAGLIRWVGPVVSPDALPRFEIAYDDQGEVAHFDQHLGAEPDLTPDLLDTDDVRGPHGSLPPLASCVPFLDADLQRVFVHELLARGCVVATNTYGLAARTHTERVRGTSMLADAFFCNAVEAGVLFGDLAAAPGPVGAVRFVTLGGAGAVVQRDDRLDHVPAPRVAVVDPTGAGDTFCGTVLGRLAQGDHPVQAARAAVVAAAGTVQDVGPAALLRPAPPSPPGPVHVDHARVTVMGALLARLDEVQPFDFVAPDLPPVGDPGAVAWFFAAVLQQFGFWHDDGERWTAPATGTLHGVTRKGSDHLWALYRRWADDDPAAMTAAHQASLDTPTVAARLADDDGVPLPAMAERLACAQAYGVSMQRAGWAPEMLLAAANAAPRPTAALLALLDHVGGYREDPYRKKSALLAAVLRQRPEGFLRVVAHDDVPAIVDYHVQRSCLRTGLVVVDDGVLRRRLEQRRLLTAVEEDAVRAACVEAVDGLVAASGRSMGAVDWFLFGMRRRCPETTVPDCDRCPARPACARDVDLFQPVLRTTAY